MPSATVILVTYNTAPYIEQTLQGLADQTSADFHLAVMDDASTDGTGEILKDQLPERLGAFGWTLTVNEENKERAWCRNQLIDQAETPIIIAHDGDDISLPDRVETTIAYFNDHPRIDLLSGGLEVVDANGDRIERWDFTDDDGQAKYIARGYGPSGNPVYHTTFVPELNRRTLEGCLTLSYPACAFRKSLWEDIGGFENWAIPAEDFQFFLKSTRRHQSVSIDKVMVKHRLHKNSSSITDTGRQIANKKKAINEELRLRGVA